MRSGASSAVAYGEDSASTRALCLSLGRIAISALRAQAIDYLVKPVDPADLGAALQRAREQLRVRRDQSLADRLGPPREPSD